MVLLLRAAFAIRSLFAFCLLSHTSVADRGFTNPTEVCTVEGEHGTVNETFSDIGAKLTLFVEEAEGFEFEYCAEFPVG